MRKRVLSGIIALLMVVSLLPVSASADSECSEHSFGEWTVVSEADCTEVGVETRTCESCGETENRQTPALGHVYILGKCSRCGSMVRLFKQLDSWDESDARIPNPGDIIFFDWDDNGYGDNTGFPGHVGIVEKVVGSTVTVIDGNNKDDAVGRRTIEINGRFIRGYGVPKYKPSPSSQVRSDYSNAVSVRAETSAPIVKITTSAGKPRIYWNSQGSMTKYWIYRSTDGVNFKYYDTTTKTSYTNASTDIGTTYYYKVKAVAVLNGKNVTSDYSVVKSIQCRPAAVNISIYRVNGKPQLKWKAVSGATKYWIYRSTDGVNFKYFDSTTKTSYTNSGAASGTKYYYRVKAVAVVKGKNVASAYSNSKNLMTSLAAPSVSITTSNGKPKITWKAVTGADKYYIYRSTDGKNFSYWDATANLSYTNLSAKKNTKYYYKVKAVCATNSNANSAQSAAVSITATK